MIIETWVLLSAYTFGAFMFAVIFAYKPNDVVIAMALFWPILAIFWLMATALQFFRWVRKYRKVRLRSTFLEVKAEVLDWFKE